MGACAGGWKVGADSGPWSIEVGFWKDPGSLQHSRTTCANNRELCKEDNIEIGAVATKQRTDST